MKKHIFSFPVFNRGGGRPPISDEFLNEWRYFLTNNAYGVDFSSNNLEILFPFVEDTEICVIEIKPWHKPLYTMVTDNNGTKSEKFYLRNGNSSPELPTSEIADYINTRFD